MNRWQARLAVRALHRGALVLHATEGLWGFACDPFDRAAVARLLACKGRAPQRGLIVIGAGSGVFETELAALDPATRGEVEGSWPGPVTWVVPNRRFPPWITGGRDTVAVRVPAHPQARALCEAFRGPLVSTSANRSGRPPARRRLQARALLESLSRSHPRMMAGSYLLPGETQGRAGASEIRTVAGERLRGPA